MQVIKPTQLATPDGSITRASLAYYWSSAKVMTEAANNELRFNYNPDTEVFEGLVIEAAATNLLLNSTTLSTQTVTVTNATQYTISFYGTGTVTLSGAAVATIVGTGTYKRKTLTITTTTTSLVVTVSGTVSYAQLELGTKATSWMKTLGASATRAAETPTGTGLMYTSVTDATAVWSNATTYLLGAKVRYGTRIYESLQASNLNHQPDTSPTWWLNTGPDNMHAAFDDQVNTISTGITKMTFVVKPGTAIDSVALINMSAIIARVTVFDPTAGLVDSRVAGLSGQAVYDWYQYFFFNPLLKRTQVVFTTLPAYTNAYITIQLEGNPSDVVSVAVAIFGLVEDLGGTQYGATSGIVDYSIKSTDDFGNVTFVKRNFSKRLSAQLYIENSKLNRAQRFLYDTRATPVVWVGTDDPRYEEALVLYGFYKEFSVEIPHPGFSVCSLEIESLT